MAKTDEHVIQLEVEIKKDGTITIPPAILNELTKHGGNEFTVSFKPSSSKQLSDLNIPSSVIKQIESIQELPQSVILEFFESKGSIEDLTFLNRIEAYA